MPDVHCETCGTSFHKPQCYVKRNKHHYCSPACRYRRNEVAPEKRTAHFWRQVDKRGPDECWLWLGKPTKSRGYGRFSFNKTTELAHRVSYELAHSSPAPDDLMVIHSCDNPMCVNPHHLRLGTHQDNMHDVTERGRWRGDKSHNAKLAESQVREIKDLLRHGSTHQAIADMYNVHRVTISQIARGANWSHVV